MPPHYNTAFFPRAVGTFPEFLFYIFPERRTSQPNNNATWRYSHTCSSHEYKETVSSEEENETASNHSIIDYTKREGQYRLF